MNIAPNLSQFLSDNQITLRKGDMESLWRAWQVDGDRCPSPSAFKLFHPIVSTKILLLQRFTMLELRICGKEWIRHLIGRRGHLLRLYTALMET